MLCLTLDRNESLRMGRAAVPDDSMSPVISVARGFNGVSGFWLALLQLSSSHLPLACSIARDAAVLWSCFKRNVYAACWCASEGRNTASERLLLCVETESAGEVNSIFVRCVDGPNSGAHIAATF